MSDKSIDLYYFPPSPPCRLVQLVARELDIEDKIELKSLSLFDAEQLKEEFTSINPHHTIPTIVDHEEGDFVLYESRAIIQYLVRKFAPQSTLIPSDLKGQTILDQCMFLDASSLYPVFMGMFTQIVHGKVKPTPQSIEMTSSKLQLLDHELNGKNFAVGDELTLGDFCYLVTLDTIDAISFITDLKIESFENLHKYVTNLKESLTYYDEVMSEPTEKLIQIIQARLEEGPNDDE